MLHTVISGGQTGVDQAGLIAAQKFGLRTGGTCPAGWQTQHGPNYLLSSFGLVAEGTLRSRTIANVKNSDGTVLLTITPQSPGSILTRNEVRTRQKPFLELDLNPIMAARASGDTVGILGNEITVGTKALHQFFLDHPIGVLNVAGNRERDVEMNTTKAAVSLLLCAFEILDLDGLIQKQN